MAGEVEKYIAANAAYIKTGQLLAPLIRAVVSVGHALEHYPEGFSFTGTEAAITPQIATHQRRGLSAQEWPSAERLQIALSNWHQAYGEANAAWNAVPKETQASLRSPVRPDSSVRHADRQQ